jgi:glycosyltransferase involved in cell wall biosynthesis
VKNEAWILDRFLACASLWADHIVIADQGSTDGSRDIAKAHSKVILIENPANGLNEGVARRILIDAARQFSGPRLMLALDADEVLTANVLRSPEWVSVLAAPPGTIIRFQWAILEPDMASYWLSPMEVDVGFMDDGREYSGAIIHQPRVPAHPAAPVLTLHEIKLMHYVGVDPARWGSKHRWYQCWERLNRPERGAIEIYRQYHRKDVVPPWAIRPLPAQWLQGYIERGIDMTSTWRDCVYHSDAQVLEWLLTYGPRRFRREDIWAVNWAELYRQIRGRDPDKDLSDPRSPFDRAVHRWLKMTQGHYSYYPDHGRRLSRACVRLIQRCLRVFGW